VDGGDKVDQFCQPSGQWRRSMLGLDVSSTFRVTGVEAWKQQEVLVVFNGKLVEAPPNALL